MVGTHAYHRILLDLVAEVSTHHGLDADAAAVVKNAGLFIP